jgi:hypothetical protein
MDIDKMRRGEELNKLVDDEIMYDWPHPNGEIPEYSRSLDHAMLVCGQIQERYRIIGKRGKVTEVRFEVFRYGRKDFKVAFSMRPMRLLYVSAWSLYLPQAICTAALKVSRAFNGRHLT